MLERERSEQAGLAVPFYAGGRVCFLPGLRGSAVNGFYLRLFALDLLPQRFERIDTGAGAALGGEHLDPAEAALEFCRRAAQGRLRVDVELACEVGGGEQDVAHLVLNLRQVGASIAGGELRFELRDLLGDLFDDRARRGPVEADPRRTLLDLGGAQQGRESQRHAVEYALAGPSCLGPGAALTSLVLFPGLGLRRGRGDFRG